MPSSTPKQKGHGDTQQNPRVKVDTTMPSSALRGRGHGDPSSTPGQWGHGDSQQHPMTKGPWGPPAACRGLLPACLSLRCRFSHLWDVSSARCMLWNTIRTPRGPSTAQTMVLTSEGSLAPGSSGSPGCLGGPLGGTAWGAGGGCGQISPPNTWSPPGTCGTAGRVTAPGDRVPAGVAARWPHLRGPGWLCLWEAGGAALTLGCRGGHGAPMPSLGQAMPVGGCCAG